MEARRRGKKKVAPDDRDQLVGTNNGSFQMNEKENSKLLGDKSFEDIVKEMSKGQNVLKVISDVKAHASRWLEYTTTRRFRRRDGPAQQPAESDNAGNSVDSKESGGLGLDDIHEAFVSPSTIRQNSKSSNVPDLMNCEMAVASNRALLQYFGKLGQSRDLSEVINLDFVETLLSSGADINCTDRHGQTILHEVAREWHIDVAKFLIEHGVDINRADSFGRTPLHVAAAVDYPAMVTLLIENGADKESRTFGENQTPVFYAAKTDAVQSLKVLLNQGCLFKFEKDFKGRTPIHVAAELDRSETARYLLNNNAPVWVPDKSGTRAITWMINKMAPVAIDALNQFHLTDRPNRKQRFYLNYLIRDEATDPDGRSHTPLHVAVSYKLTDLLMHHVFLRYLDIQWAKFGRFWALINLALNLAYIILWTAIGMTVDYDQRHVYVMPDDIWRVVLYVVAVAFTLYQVCDEILEFRRSERIHSEFENRRIAEIDKDIEYCHPRWPNEKIYLDQEKKEVQKLRPKYLKDAWNIFDWICYTMLSVCVGTHVGDVINHTEELARTHIRIMAITIILLWLRLMKNARAFALLGPFVVMLSHMLKDFVKFMFLYLEFYIPFLAAFWMLFGGTKKAQDSDRMVVVDGYQYFGQTFFSMFRLTLVDEYDYANMNAIDGVMSDLMLSAWFILSSILCLNLFIALLSETFTRVYDKAEANAVMQKAITTLSIWDGLNRKAKNRFHEYIKNSCSPLTEDYDDDMTQTEDDNIKKVTIEIKEDLEKLQDMFKMQFGDPTSSLWLAENGKGGFTLTKDRFETEVRQLKAAMTDMKEEQVEIKTQMQKDLKSMKSMLKKIMTNLGQDVETEMIEKQSVTSETTPVTKLKRKKKKKSFEELEDKSAVSSVRDSQTTLDITSVDFSPATFPDVTRSVMPEVFDVPLYHPPSVSRLPHQKSNGGEDSSNC